MAVLVSCKDEENAENSEDEENVQANYEAFRSVKDLSDTANTFYQVVANIAGLKLETLTRAVYMLEQKIIKWERQKGRAERQDAAEEAGG